MKTDLLESMRGLPSAHFIDEVTKDTFLSGKVDDPKKGRRIKSASLLHRIGNDGSVISANFSTFSSNEEKNLSAILSQLRRIYDGNYCHEFGTDEHLDERTWSGRLTLLAGATPAIDRHFAVFQLLGERFLRVRWPRVGGVSAAVKAMSHRRELLPEFRQIVRPLLLPILERDSIPAPHIPDDLQVRIGSVSEIAALARAYVHRDSQSREMSN